MSSLNPAAGLCRGPPNHTEANQFTRNGTTCDRKITGRRSSTSAVLCTLITFAVAPLACVGGGGLQPGEGYRFDVSGHEYLEDWDAAVMAVGRVAQTTTLKKDRGEVTGEVLSDVGPDDRDITELVGVWITPTTPGAETYTVEVQSQAFSALNLTSQDWTGNIVAAMKHELDTKKPEPESKSGS